jgi:hypothetical protein
MKKAICKHVICVSISTCSPDAPASPNGLELQPYAYGLKRFVWPVRSGCRLIAAAELPDRVDAVVLRGGRPIGWSRLPQVQAPTLLTGGNDGVVGSESTGAWTDAAINRDKIDGHSGSLTSF